MKQTVYFFFAICFMMIVSPAFQCGEEPYDVCPTYIQDTAILRVQVPNNNGSFEVLDTIQILSVISDTIRTVKGKTFLSPINTLNTNIQAYKIIQTNTNNSLNYANVEFNAVVIEGEIQNYPFLGYTFLHRRILPFNRLNTSLVAGFRGLYLIVVNSSDYGLFIREPNNNCTSYAAVHFVDETQQQKQYWDSLGTTSLRLSGNNNFVVANKMDRNYFFVKVN